MNTRLPMEDAETERAPQIRPQPGAGTRLTVNDLGFSINADTGGIGYSHPFKPALGAGFLTFSRGLVDGLFEPKIGKLAMSDPRARLKLDGALANANGESWACLEVEPDSNGLLTADSRIELVNSSEPRSLNPLIGRVAVAQILWKNRRAGNVFSIIKFNLRYIRVLPADSSKGVVQHFFL